MGARGWRRVLRRSRGCESSRPQPRIFAEHGYEGSSIRNIVANADVNQAAINYHFGSKEGLYRAVLSGALQALLEADESSPAPQALPRETALRAFIHRQLRPMLARDERSQSLRIFNWETVRPSPGFRTFMAEVRRPCICSRGERGWA